MNPMVFHDTSRVAMTNMVDKPIFRRGFTHGFPTQVAEAAAAAAAAAAAEPKKSMAVGETQLLLGWEQDFIKKYVFFVDPFNALTMQHLM